MYTGVIIKSKIMVKTKGGYLMKKALSVFLAVLMMFSVLSIGSTATGDTTAPGYYNEDWFGPNAPANYNQVVLQFNLNGGTLKGSNFVVWNLDTGKPEYVDGTKVESPWVMVPLNSTDMVADGKHSVTLPAITPPDGRSFDCWYCPTDGNGYGANSPYVIPASKAGQVIEFTAQWSAANYEEDTITKVMGILFKVFGTIIGLLFYAGDTEAGIAMMEKVFGGLF